MINTLRGAIFDMDGTLCDSEPVHTEAWLAVMREHGATFAPDWFAGWSGKTEESLAEHIAANYELGVSAEQLLARKRAVYRDLARERLRAFPGLGARLDRLGSRGIRRALCTSSNRDDALNTLTCIGLLEAFPTRVSCDDVDRHKPDPAPFLLAAEKLSLPPAACVAFEDSPAGVQSAKAAGCVVLAVTTGHTRAQLAQADRIFPDTVAAVEWVLAGNAG